MARMPGVQRGDPERRLGKRPGFRELRDLAQRDAAKVHLVGAGQPSSGRPCHAHAAFRLDVGPFGPQTVIGHQHVFGDVLDQAVVKAPGRVFPKVREG